MPAAALVDGSKVMASGGRGREPTTGADGGGLPARGYAAEAPPSLDMDSQTILIGVDTRGDGAATEVLPQISKPLPLTEPSENHVNALAGCS